MGRLANTVAPEPEVTRPFVPDPRPITDYVEPAGASPITNPILIPETRALEPTPNCFRSSGTETRDARRAVAYFSKLDLDARNTGGDISNGLHAVIARQANGLPRGQQLAWPQAQRSTLFRTPEPWDRGSSTATPASGG